MRNSTSGSTSKTNTAKDTDCVSTNNIAEKTSAKKMKQARLPFKVIAPGTSPVGSKTTTTPAAVAADKEKDATKDTNTDGGRKRKLSYDETDNDDDDGFVAAVEVDDDDNVSKENVEVLKAATKKKKLSNVNNNDTTEIVSLLDDEDDGDVGLNKNVGNTSIVVSGNDKKDALSVLKTPKVTTKDKRKGAGTPQTSSAQKDNNGSASKLQIKLPLSAGKKKRRKSKLHQLSLNNSAEKTHNNSAQELSSDDIEEIAVELNPLKRKKLNTEEAESKKSQQEVETIALDSEPEEVKDEVTETKVSSNKRKLENTISAKKFSEKTVNRSINATPEIKNNEKPKRTSSSESGSPETKNKDSEKSSEDEEEDCIKISDVSVDGNEKQKDLDESVLSDNDNEADDETDNLAGKAAHISSDVRKETEKDDKNLASSSSKNLTPKQTKLMEQRRKAREDKERKLQEEKMKKQQEKEEKELAKKREREEKEEQRRKERDEKEEQRRKERDEKERKRLAELEAKNEEKRKKNEAKEEELRKKEEERKRKEQEKEEAELKKKKAAQAFTKFFVAKTTANSQLKCEEDSNTGDDTKLLAFRPFQVKGDMKLAPICRKTFKKDAKNRLDDLLGCRDNDDEEIMSRKPLSKTELYLSELRSGKILPGKWRRLSTESKDDVILVEDELERVGQEIVEDTPANICEKMRVKFLKFHDNRRPPYYGTWRKKSAFVTSRKPLGQDTKFFDYEVDSDIEWEEEEPGESLEDGSDDDKEKESEDDDYEVDNEWFVPHGHLSDEELQNEDECGMGDDNTREAQKAKLQILQQEFAQEMKKKTEKIKPRLIGCIWADINGNQPTECAKIIWDTLEKKAMLFTEPPLIEEAEDDKSAEQLSPSGATNGNAEKSTTDKLKPITLSDNMVKDLARLIHGNKHSKNFLINEYIAFIEKTEESVKNGDLRKPLKTVVRDKIDEMAEWQAIDATAATVQDIERANDETTDNTKKKKKGKKRLCWVVNQEFLNKLNLPLLELQNSWEYTLPPKFVKADKEGENTASNTEIISNCATPTVAEDNATKGKNVVTSQITKFTKVLTAEEKASKLQNTPSSSTESKANTPSTSKEKKRVPLLMSVARGQQISTPAKNKLISNFLQKGKDNSAKTITPTSSRSKTTTSPQVEDDDVVILD